MTVNGTPISNGRKALEMVMGSRQLVEVLHCDERVWRDDWLWDALEEAEGRKKKSLQEVMSRLFRKDGNAVPDGEDGNSIRAAWNLEWNTERDEVILYKKDVDWAFKLVFDNVAGTCHSQEVTDKMMPPTDEFDVSLFAQFVNEKQRTIMQVLQNMLSRAKFELQFGSTSLRRSHRESNALGAGTDARPEDRFRRKMSYDGLHMMLMNDGDEEDDEEMSNLVNDLLRVDDRDRRRKSQGQDETREGRRGSTGHIEALTAANFTAKDLEAWYIANMGKGVSNNDKIHWYHSRLKKMEEHQENKMFKSDASSRSYASSMFSADILEDYLDDLENFNDIHGDPPPPAENTEEDGSLTSEESSPPQSPRSDQKFEDHNISTKSSNSNYSETEEKNPDEQNAFITGVFRDVSSKYDVSNVVVGSGGFGEVRECNDKKTGKTYVVKTITKPPPDDTSKINLVRNEILLLHEAKHPNIVELKDLFEDSKCVHIVMERCTGGDLFDRVVNDNPARIRHRAEAMKHEARTASAMRSIMQVIKYLHSKGIVHRDIKPEHFLLTTEKKESQRIKLIDFGLARKHKPGSPPMTTFTGSPSFVAPEVIARSYDHMCDLFSTGVTAYFLLTGMLPFDGPSDEDTFDLISMGVFRFPSSSIHLSDEARDFVTRLLKTDPNQRMTADEALDHPWLKKDASC
jgi:calcium-dependent protein kinase